MSQSSQTIEIENLNTSVHGDSIERKNSLPYLLSSAENEIKRVLTPVNSSKTSNLPTNTTATVIQPNPSENYVWKKGISAPIIELPLPKTPVRPKTTFRALQEWEGYVVSIEEDEFVARLIDITAGATCETEEAIIPLKEISDNDVANLEIGSKFRWVIGYEQSPEGTRKRISEIIFRDLPRITESDLQAGREWAKKIIAAFTS